MRVPEELLEVLRQENKFIIASHINPEGDALGSSIALCLALKSIGKEAHVFNTDGVPYLYQFLPSMQLIKTSLDGLPTQQYCLVLVDCNEPDRAGIEDYRFKLNIVVDHHLTRKSFGDIKWIEPESAATGLMIYHIIKALGIKIDRDMAENLYTAISIDTGTFRYDNTTSEVLRVAAELVDLGADPARVAIRLYESWTYKRFKLLLEMLNTLEVIKVKDIKVAITHITLDMFKQTDTTQADTENFSNFPRMIDEVDVSVMFRQIDEDTWKASMRGKGAVNLALVAASLGGGGHRNAAGFKAEGNLEDLKARLIKSIEDNINQ